MVGTGTVVESVGPGMAHQFDEVMVALLVFGKEYEVPAARVDFSFPALHRPPCTVHLTAEYRRKVQVRIFFLQFLHIIEVFLDSKHIAVVGHSHALHPVGNSFIHKLTDLCLTVQHRILRMDMQMYKIWCHRYFFSRGLL